MIYEGMVWVQLLSSLLSPVFLQVNSLMKECLRLRQVDTPVFICSKSFFLHPVTTVSLKPHLEGFVSTSHSLSPNPLLPPMSNT